MNAKMRYNYWVDMLFLVSMLVVTLTGVVLWGWLRPAGGAPGGENKGARPEAVATAGAAPNAEANVASNDASRGEQKRERGAGGEGIEARQGGAQSGPEARQGGAGQAQGDARILWGLFHGKTFLGMTKNGGWKGIHCWVSVILLVPLMILHLISHFRWLWNATFPRKKSAEQKSAPEGAPEKAD